MMTAKVVMIIVKIFHVIQKLDINFGLIVSAAGHDDTRLRGGESPPGIVNDLNGRRAVYLRSEQKDASVSPIEGRTTTTSLNRKNLLSINRTCKDVCALTTAYHLIQK
jgi:hypothetical protein